MLSRNEVENIILSMADYEDKYMKKEIVIGTDLKPLFNSICLWRFGHASQNPGFYILDSEYATVFIYKEAPEAKEIEEWLSVEENRNNDSVDKKVLEFLLPRMSADEFIAIIERETEASWCKGYTQAQRDIRKALGI